MKKTIAIILCLVLLIAALMTSCGKTEGRTLNLYTWSGMFPQEILDAFTEKTGIKINYVNFDTDETFNKWLDGVKEDIKALNQERADKGLDNLGAPGTGGVKKDPDKVEPMTEAEVDALAAIM